MRNQSRGVSTWRELDSCWDDVVDKLVPLRLSASGVDQPTVHQIQQLPEHHDLHLAAVKVKMG
ncbi:hypothetical protein GWO69_01890 [Corynebacterium macginleyi]|uniref:Uncharacterized protein n=1 Tax=Corynebacterium macginleyi TaxID=38290 RepID=A0A3M0GM10_9CORY|nr:hypothetical protein [Corynebacterium macginleyi]MBK4147270.1 hypothetical protein [Corynebacterium macginleyi]MBK4151227.1 hypothetical protein [Corynebacterium macginleyi]MBK4156257.1 hypothetical protein [Corynebacterium macginleyi]MBK4165391.1 hypothetical protein [Corynebacterium macginleyi]MBK4168172.1 hypothetical protein [Corynebacterium macginleyi]